MNCDDASNWLPVKEMDIGIGTRKALACIVSESDKKKICYSFRSALIKTVSYMQTRLPLSNLVLRDLQCLHPLARKTDEGKTAFQRLCTHLQKVTKTDAFCDTVQAEWLLYMCETDSTIDQWYDNHQDAASDICRYWNYIAQLSDCTGDRKYKNLSIVVKSALTLSHGNAAPERGFSVNNSLLSKERLALGEETIRSERIVKEAIRLYGSVTNIPISKQLIAISRKSYMEYAAKLERERNERRLMEEEKQKQEFVNKEKKRLADKKESICKVINEQEEKESEQMVEQNIAQQLISEASTKLSESLKKNDLSGAKVRQLCYS